MRPSKALWLPVFIAVPTALVLAQPPRSGDSAEAAIEKVIVESYVQGIHINRDAEAIERGFHPDFVMSVYDDGQLVQVTLPQWLSRMSLGEKNTHEIGYEFEKIDVTGNAAQVRLAVFRDGEQVYTDYFGLYEFPDGWKIVNKIFKSHR
jgi:hypothetical protein